MVATVLLVYTLVMLLLGQLSHRRRTNKAASSQQFLDGGRSFGFWRVFTLVSAMWCSWMVSVELETGFLSGISAVWFGGSVIVMSILVAAFLLEPFRKIGYLTNSNLVGRRFGNLARDISALVIGVTFPIFAMSNVLAAAAFLHVILGWPLWITLVGSTLLILAYVSMNGIWSIAYTQAANLLVMVAGFAIATVFALHHHSVFVPSRAPSTSFLNLFGVGPGMILVWLFMNILNSVSAQAEFQAIAAVKNPRTGRRAVYLSSLLLLAFALIPVLLGMATREYFPHAANGLIAFPMYLRYVAPNWAIALVALGFWASALTWCAPLLFSGASSLGLDLLNRVNLNTVNAGAANVDTANVDPAQVATAAHHHHGDKIRRWTRWSLLVQGGLVVIYALIRPDEIAWWQVFGLTIRNGAIVAPTIAFLLWPVVRSRTVIVSMVLGVLSGLAWNAATGFSATVFWFGINPMWIGTGVSFVAMMIDTCCNAKVPITLTRSQRRRVLGTWFAIAGTILFAASVELPRWHLQTLLGPALFLGVTAWFFSLVNYVEERHVESIPKAAEPPVIGI